MESKTSLSAKWNEIPKFKSDTSKEVYFFANVAEDVWVQLKECLEADYRRQLHFQLTQDGVAVPAGEDESKVFHDFHIDGFVLLKSTFHSFLRCSE